MYLIVNYEKFEKYPMTFDWFENALMIWNSLNDSNNIIEYWGNGYREIVWEKWYEEA